MTKPNLQLALDHQDLSSAIYDAQCVGEQIDILEVGTILMLQEGQQAVRCLRALFPEKKLIADTKCADAGTTVARNVAEAGADWMTVICAATIPTMQAAAKEVEQLQVELYGDWTWEQADQWRKIGIQQVIYHQSRDALLAGGQWTDQDLKQIKELIQLGFSVSVTGGLTVETLKIFQGLPIHTFITGRGITAAADPLQAALDFQEELVRIWG